MQPGSMPRFALILTLLTASAFAAAPEITFSLTVTIYSLPREKLWTYRLSPDAISITRYAVEGGRNTTAYRRDLSRKERRSLIKFFQRFPLDSLQSKYIDENNRGTTYYEYHFLIQRSSRDIYVYYARPDELLELNHTVNRLLPRRYHLWNEKD